MALKRVLQRLIDGLKNKSIYVGLKLIFKPLLICCLFVWSENTNALLSLYRSNYTTNVL